MLPGDSTRATEVAADTCESSSSPGRRAGFSDHEVDVFGGSVADAAGCEVGEEVRQVAMVPANRASSRNAGVDAEYRPVTEARGRVLDGAGPTGRAIPVIELNRLNDAQQSED